MFTSLSTLFKASDNETLLVCYQRKTKQSISRFNFHLVDREISGMRYLRDLVIHNPYRTTNNVKKLQKGCVSTKHGFSFFRQSKSHRHVA